MIKKIIKILLTILLLGFSSCNRDETTANWSKIFQKHNALGTFVLKNISTQKTLVYKKQRAKTLYVPASTFKILNSMIALQVSAIASVDDTIKWDGVDRGTKSWNQNHTMRTAIPVSCVWFYQELARKIGKNKMQEWINKSDYGNKKIENKIDLFWLDGNLKISAIEQVEFLEKLIKNELPFDKNIQKKVKEIIITDATKNYTIHSKTGWSQKIGWYVGYIEAKDNIWIFAMNMDMDHIKMAKNRKLITYNILREQGIIK